MDRQDAIRSRNELIPILSILADPVILSSPHCGNTLLDRRLRADEQLGDLHGVRRRALAEIVAHAPERQAVGAAKCPRGCGR